MSNRTTVSRQYWAPHVTVAAIVEHEGRFLMVEEQIKGSIVMTQPAGHLEPNESLADAVVREVLEETGLRFIPTALVGIYRWHNPANESTWLRFTFTGEIDGNTTPSPRDADILRAGWFSDADIRGGGHALRSPQVLAGIDDYNKGMRIALDLLGELGSEPLK